MNRKIVFNMLGRIVLLEAVLLLLPTVCSIIYHEACTFSFLITIGIAAVVGIALVLLNKPKDETMFAKEGFAIVGLAWIVLSAIGALPFFISREIPSYIDAFFETVSGFTTTGASILTNVEIMSKGLLFWRSFTHWIGGMGVLVLIMAILPTDSGSAIHIMRAEMPGPIVGKLVPKIKSTAKILYLIYIALTVIQTIMLWCGEMSFFESLIHSFGTAGTGGFGVKNDSIGGYGAYSQWVITVFMLIFGVNFNLYYLILARKGRTALKSEELWCYITILIISIGVITYKIAPMMNSLSDSIRHSAFQVASIISTTGYSSTDFNLWPTLTKGIMLIIMFTGACAGSTAGGFKLSRVILLFKSVRSNLKHMLHSRSVETVRLEGKVVDDSTVRNAMAYLAVYMLCFGIAFLILCFDSFSFETNFSATLACINNIGPGFDAVGPASNFAALSNLSKLTLSAAMLIGRLEIFPMLLIFSPSVWIKTRKTVKKG